MEETGEKIKIFIFLHIYTSGIKNKLSLAHVFKRPVKLEIQLYISFCGEIDSKTRH
jgi:hypothetical protein